MSKIAQNKVRGEVFRILTSYTCSIAFLFFSSNSLINFRCKVTLCCNCSYYNSDCMACSRNMFEYCCFFKGDLLLEGPLLRLLLSILNCSIVGKSPVYLVIDSTTYNFRGHVAPEDHINPILF